MDTHTPIPYINLAEGDEEGTSVVAIMDPVAQLSVADNESVAELGAEVRDRLERVLDGL